VGPGFCVGLHGIQVPLTRLPVPQTRRRCGSAGRGRRFEKCRTGECSRIQNGEPLQRHGRSPPQEIVLGLEPRLPVETVRLEDDLGMQLDVLGVGS